MFLMCDNDFHTSEHSSFRALQCKTPKNIKYTTDPGEGVLPYMGYIGMCRCEGYGFQAVYSRIGYINQSIGF